MDNRPKPSVIDFKDEMLYLDDDEFLKKYYPLKNLGKKMKAITDYYKYHVEIPRVYMVPLCIISNCYLIILGFHDKKRRINYYRVKKILHAQ